MKQIETVKNLTRRREEREAGNSGQANQPNRKPTVVVPGRPDGRAYFQIMHRSRPPYLTPIIEQVA
ncbi:MAG: hypothetical protein WCR49_01520 [Opitutae bacterium]